LRLDSNNCGLPQGRIQPNDFIPIFPADSENIPKLLLPTCGTSTVGFFIGVGFQKPQTVLQSTLNLRAIIMKDSSVGKAVRTGTWGLLLGAAAGFALGVLFAPEEGKKLRRKVAYQLDNLGGVVADFIDQAIAEEESSGEARRDGDALVAEAKEKADVISGDIDALLDEIRQQPSDG